MNQKRNWAGGKLNFEVGLQMELSDTLETTNNIAGSISFCHEWNKGQLYRDFSCRVVIQLFRMHMQCLSGINKMRCICYISPISSVYTLFLPATYPFF